MQEAEIMTAREFYNLVWLRARQGMARPAIQNGLRKLDDETGLQTRNEGLLKRFSSSVAKFLSRHA